MFAFALFILPSSALAIIIIHAPVLTISPEGGYADDPVSPGVHPNIGTMSASVFVFKVVYTQRQNFPPSTLNLVLTDGTTTTTYPMYLDGGALDPILRNGNYADGEQYVYSSTFAPGIYNYHFESDFGARLPATSTWMFSANADPGCTVNCYSNVLFLPGIEASRLYRPDYNGGTDQLWEPNTENDVTDLFLTEEGKSIRNDVYTKDVVNEVNVLPIGQTNIYKSFLADLDTWKNTDHLIADYAAVPYDWRLSLDDILNYGNNVDGRIYYSGDFAATSTPYILQELRRLAASSRTGKVTIVAHSNGGLLTKALIQKLGNVEAALLIDKIIFVAVPQVGTPMAVGALLHGYEQGLPFNWFPAILNPATARAFASTSPMAYNLLPSAAYFGGEGGTTRTALIRFDDGTLTQPFIDAYGRGITNPPELHDFLLGSEGRIAPAPSDIKSPSILHSALLSSGENVHQALDDNWSPPSGVAIHQIAGWGEDTLGGIRYWTGTECVYVAGRCIDYRPKLEYTPLEVIDGDGTVVVSSALAMSTSTPNISRWWVNLRKYDELLRFNVERKHADILEVPEIRILAKTILTNSVIPSFEFISTNQPAPKPTGSRLRFTIHSPLDLSAVDSEGNIVNSATSTIHGSRYKRYGEVQVLSVPLNMPITLHLDGYASGSFTLDIEEISGNNVTTSSSTILAIPCSTSTRATMSFAGGTLQNASPLMVDYNGDTLTDFMLTPKVGDIVTLPLPPAYYFDGFLQPVNDTAYHPEQSLSVFKGGSTIPVKFQLKSRAGSPIQAETIPLWLTPERGVSMWASVDESSYVVSGTSGDTFRWDSGSQQYIYNWSTKGLLVGYWYRIATQLDDGKTYSVTVGLR